MIPAFFQDEIGALAGGQDVFDQIDLVDLCPDGMGALTRCLVGEAGIAMEIGSRIAESRIAQGEKALDVPLADILYCSIDINGKVKKVGDEYARLRFRLVIPRLQHV